MNPLTRGTAVGNRSVRATRSGAEFGWPDGDRPGKLEFRHEPPVAVSRAVLASIVDRLPAASDPRALLRGLHASSQPVGAYRLSVANDEWFVRVTSRLGEPELESAVLDWLRSAGTPVNAPVLTDARLSWAGRELRVDVRPLIQGRHFNGSRTDLTALAATLGSLHRAMADFPKRSEVRRGAVARYEKFAAARELIANAVATRDFKIFGNEASWAGCHVEWLARMAEEFTPFLDRVEGAQCLHGEVHRANVIFDDGRAVLVDFEESVHTFAPPEWDLAFVVQRFCLEDLPGHAPARRRVASMEEAYGAPLPPLTATMRQTSWFSIAKIVALRSFWGIETPEPEYRKFVSLERQTRKYEGVV